MNRLILIILIVGMALAQQPIGVKIMPVQGDVFFNYYDLSIPYRTAITGDSYIGSAWLASNMAVLMPDPTGLPIIGAANDGHSTGCGGGGNILTVQLGKVAPVGTTGTSS